ncbi:hypothetical protein ACFWY9_00505 [Amycolatopsis sp. NPDC059027]|uniref:hypothetical protein n=1 Tax=unclassified Amycolatopsis TaxID=2618356 RepID=UPI00366D6A2C
MRSAVKVLGIGAVMVLAAACQDNAPPKTPAGNSVSPTASSVAPPSAPPSTSATPPVAQPGNPPGQSRPTQGVPAGDTALPATQVDSSGMGDGYARPVAAADGGKTLFVQEEQRGCDQLDAKATEQDDRQVVVLITVIRAARSQVCPDHVKEITLPVPLTAPIGARKVVLRLG